MQSTCVARPRPSHGDDEPTVKPYCPVCRTPLDEDGRCWAVCALAGISQPPIHLGEFEVDEYELRNGFGETVRVYRTERLVST